MKRMVALLAQTWKPLLSVTLLCSILASVAAPPPRRHVAGAEVRGLAVAAVALYLTGAFGELLHLPVLSGIVFSAGILACSRAVWLSRGARRDGGAGGGGQGEAGPNDGRWPPPTGPDGLPTIDWDRFERERQAWSERRPTISV